jgi:hypothetical protein
MLFFRIERELKMSGRGELVWIAWADWLLVTATLICLVGVILPITFNARITIPAASAAVSSTLVAGYVFGIMAHYRILFGSGRTGPRTNPEPAERNVVYVTVAFAVGVGIARLSLWPG